MSTLTELLKTIPEKITTIKLPNPVYEMNVTPSVSVTTTYFPKEIANFINSRSADKLSFKGSSPLPYECNFYCYGQTIPLEKLQKQMKCVVWWLSTIRKYSHENCDDLVLDVYLTPFKKSLSNRGVPLTSINCNTGFTTRCDMGHTIVLYREEEWFKVFVHESIHYFGLDFAYSQPPSVWASLKNIFCVSSEINLYEAYTEFWAEIIVMLLHSVVDNKNLSTLIKEQKKYGVEQAKKVLHSQGTPYSTIIGSCGTLPKYREKTNAFSYYVITTLFMYYHKEFIQWCVDNNTNLLHFNLRKFPDLLEWIKRYYSSPEFVSALEGARMSGDRSLRMIHPNINI